jgi:lysophospholipase L1-like esterase
MARVAHHLLFAAAIAVASGCSRPSQKAAPAEASSATPLSGSLDVSVDAGPVAKLAEAPVAAPTGPRPLAGKKVLHVGDSMVGGKWGLTRALEAKLVAAGATIVRHTKVSESLMSFDKSPTLRDLIRTHEPDIVLITLGANDASVPYPEAFAHNVQNIVHRVGSRECWWLGPPIPNETGIVSVIKENAGSCRFFDASKLELDRASDGIHPNDRGATKWAEAFWTVFAEAPAL